jgi:hypothetical protein
MVRDPSRPLIPFLPHQHSTPSATEVRGGKMKKSACIISGVLTILLISSSTSYAWNTRGHMMVAAVATKS